MALTPAEAVRRFRERIERRSVADRDAEARALALVGSFAMILRAAGARRIVLFGSLALKTFGARSDIDLAVSGLSEASLARFEREFTLGAQRPVDLINLDRVTPAFRTHIERFGQELP